MKKLFPLSLVFTLVLSACVKENFPAPDKSAVFVEEYMLTKSFEVPVVGDGTITRVILHTADGEQQVLATTDIPLNIEIPVWIDITRAATDDYIEIANYAMGTLNFEANSFVKESSSVLLFEDSRDGDFDYNDLVLYVKHSIRGNGTASNPNTITMWIKPIALGSANPIAFGWEDGNGEHMLSDNVRRDYFSGKEGIINTYEKLTFAEPFPVVQGGGNAEFPGYTLFTDRTLMDRAITGDPKADHIVGGYIKYNPVATTCSTKDNASKMIKYFIKTSGYKFYVSSIDASAPAGTYPYGLSIPNGAYHPLEAVPIWEAYPGFKSWIQTGSPVNWGTLNVQTKKTFRQHSDYARW